MKLKESKFDVLLEYSLNRFQTGGFLLGDVVIIKPAALKHEEIVNRGQSYKDLIESKIKNKELLRVTAVKSIRQDVPGRPHNSAVAGYYVDVAEEYAPGLYTNVMTLPADVLEVQDFGINLLPAAGLRRESKSKKSKIDDHQDKLGTYPKDNSLATKDTKIANANKWPNQPGGRTLQKY